MIGPALRFFGWPYPDHPGWPEVEIRKTGPPGRGGDSDSSWTRSDPPTICTATPSGTMTLDRTRPGLQAEVDLIGVPAGSGEIEPGRSESDADGCVSGQLPARAQLQIAVCSQHERLGQPARGRSEPDQRWQRQHGRLEIGMADGREDLFENGGETLERQASAPDQLVEPVDGRDPVLFIHPVQRR